MNSEIIRILAEACWVADNQNEDDDVTVELSAHQVRRLLAMAKVAAALGEFQNDKHRANLDLERDLCKVLVHKVHIKHLMAH
jgi:hypothetical protein